MNIRIETKDGHIISGRFFSKGKYTLAIEVDKNESNESCAAELVANDFEWLKSIDEMSSYWFIIILNEHIEKITV